MPLRSAAAAARLCGYIHLVCAQCAFGMCSLGSSYFVLPVLTSPQIPMRMPSLCYAVVASLTGCMPHLQVGVNHEHGEDHSVMLVSAVPRLPLRDLTIRYLDSQRGDDPATDGQGLLRCSELADLHIRSLTRLRVDVLADPDSGNTLRLAGLPELRSCHVRNGLGSGRGPPVNLCVDAVSFRGAPQLQSLRFKFDSGLQLQDGCLEQLTRLTSLTIACCGLRSIPAGVAALGATLRVLDLHSNGRLQLDEAGVGAVLQCSRLTMLSLNKPGIKQWQSKLGQSAWQSIAQQMEEEGYIPAQYSMESMWQLMRLPSAFREWHGRDLMVCLLDEEHERHCNRAENACF